MRLYKRKSKMVILFLVTVLVVLGITGCASSGNSREYVVVNPNKNEGTEEEDKSKNTLTVWCWDPAFNMNAMEKAAEVYKKEHPDFELEIIETQSDELQTKVETAVLSATTENLPDIILMQDRLFQKNVITYPDQIDGPTPKPSSNFTITDNYFMDPLKQLFQTWEKRNGSDTNMDEDMLLILTQLEKSQNRNEDLCVIHVCRTVIIRCTYDIN